MTQQPNNKCEDINCICKCDKGIMCGLKHTNSCDFHNCHKSEKIEEPTTLDWRERFRKWCKTNHLVAQYKNVDEYNLMLEQFIQQELDTQKQEILNKLRNN